MNKLEEIRQIIDDILRSQPDEEERRCGFVHLYSVSNMCSLLALKRGLDPQLGAIIGMFHDIASHRTGNYKNHAKRSAIEASTILEKIDGFSKDDIALISDAISKHSSKRTVDNIYDELIKDADVLQHYLYNTSFKVRNKEKDRLARVLEELGIQ